MPRSHGISVGTHSDAIIPSQGRFQYLTIAGRGRYFLSGMNSKLLMTFS